MILPLTVAVNCTAWSRSTERPIRKRPVSLCLPCCPLLGFFCGAVVTAANRAALHCSVIRHTRRRPHELQLNSDRGHRDRTLLSTINLWTSILCRPCWDSVMFVFNFYLIIFKFISLFGAKWLGSHLFACLVEASSVRRNISDTDSWIKARETFLINVVRCVYSPLCFNLLYMQPEPAKNR